MKKNPKTTRGVLDRFKVRCGKCSKLETFYPPHTQAYRARVHARVLGWTYRAGRGWICPGCKLRASTLPRVQVTLPGFGKVVR